MSKEKIINKPGTDSKRNTISVKAPFRIEKDEKRRFIRLEITDPLSYSVLKDREGSFWPEIDGPSYTGSILNISAGGVLVLSDAPLQEGTLVVIRMMLQGVEVINNVIGIVKRAESDEGEWLIGIEFITRESLRDYVSAAEYELIPKDVSSFDEHLRTVLNKYISERKVIREEE
ncbi:MAG: PilZ domain-containing protein [Candidatus Zixiibacteriota bacterium]